MEIKRDVSIRARVWGGRICEKSKCYFVKFQFAPACGAGERKTETVPVLRGFNSRPRVGRALGIPFSFYNSESFNSRPRVGRAVTQIISAVGLYVSIRARVWGGRSSTAAITRTGCFNSRPRVGRADADA